MQSVTELPSQFQKLSLSVSAPSQSTATNGLSEKRDLPRLIELGIVDERGEVSSRVPCDFDYHRTKKSVENCNTLLFGDRNFGPQMPSLSALLLHIQSRIGVLYTQFSAMPEYRPLAALYSETRIGGEKLFQIIGSEAHFAALKQVCGLTDIASVLSKEVLDDFCDRAAPSPENLMVLIKLHPLCPTSIRQLLVNQLHRELSQQLLTPLSPPFHGRAPCKYSGFGMTTELLQQRQFLQFVFSCDEQYGGFATADMVQLYIPDEYLKRPLTSTHPRLVTQQIGTQWLLDTLFRIIRVPDAATQSQSKMIVRYLVNGYQALGDEYAIFQREHLQDLGGANLLSFWQKLNLDHPDDVDHSYLTMLVLYKLCCQLHHEAQGSAFFQAAMQVCQNDYSTGFYKACCDLMLQAQLPLDDWEGLVQYIGYSLGMPLCNTLGRVQCSLLNQYFIDFDPERGEMLFKRLYGQLKSQEYFHRFLERLLGLPTLVPAKMQNEAIELLMLPEIDLRSKQKWIKSVIAKDEMAALALVKALLEQATEEDLAGWLQAFRNRSLFIEQLRLLPLERLEAFLQSKQLPIKRLGVELLEALSGHESLKLAWIPKLVAALPQECLGLIMSVESQVSVGEMIHWMRLTSAKAPLFYRLAAQPQSPWLEPCVKSNAKLALEVYERLYQSQTDRQYALPLLQAITHHAPIHTFNRTFVGYWARHLPVTCEACAPQILAVLNREAVNELQEEHISCLTSAASAITDEDLADHLLEFWQLIFNVAIFALAPHFIERALKCLQKRQYPLEKGHKTKLRNSLMPLLEAMQNQKRPQSALLLLHAHQHYCQELLSDDAKRHLLEAMQPKSTPEPLVSWYLTLVAKGAIAPKLVPLRQLEILLEVCQSKGHLVQPDLKEYAGQLKNRLTDAEKAAFLQKVQTMKLGKFEQLFSFPCQVSAAPAAQKLDGLQKAKALLQQKKWQPLLELLLQQNVEPKFVESTIQQAIGSVPFKLVFSLLKKYAIGNGKLWHALLQAIDLEISIECYPLAVKCLLDIKAKLTDEARREIWLELLEHGSWLNEAVAKGFFEEVSLFKGEADAKRIQKHLPAIATAAIKHAPYEFDWFFLIDPKSANRESSNRAEIAGKIFSEIEILPERQFVLHLRKVLLAYGPQRLTDFFYRSKNGKKEKILLKEPLHAFLSAAKRHAEDPLVANGVIDIILALEPIKDKDVHSFLVEELYDVDNVAILQSMIKVTQYLLFSLSQMAEPTDYYCHIENLAYALVEKILDKGSLQMLNQFFTTLFVDKDKIPSEVAPSVLPKGGEPPASASRNRLLTLFARFYPRYLEGCLRSGNLAYYKAALNVDISISLYNAKGCRQLLKKELKNPLEYTLQLFIRVLEEEHWEQPTRNLFNHLLHLATTPFLLRYLLPLEDVSLIKHESYEVGFTSLTFRKYYHWALPKRPKLDTDGVFVLDGEELYFDISALPTVWIDKADKAPLPSEISFLELVNTYIQESFKRAKDLAHNLVARARVLDSSCDCLRNLLELYPEEQQISQHMRDLAKVMDDADPFFLHHANTVLALLRAAILRKILKKDSSFVQEMLLYLKKEPRELSRQNLEPLQQIKTKLLCLQLGSFNERTLYDVVQELFQWQEEECLDAFEERLSCLQAIFAIWRHHPMLIAHEMIVRSLEKLLCPITNYFGVGLSDAGQRHALCSAQEYLNCLIDIYRASSKEHQKAIKTIAQTKNGIASIEFYGPNIPLAYLNAIIAVLMKAKKANAFNGNYELFAEYVRTVIGMFTTSRKFDLGLLLEKSGDVTDLIAMAAFGPDLYRRSLLLHEWITKFMALDLKKAPNMAVGFILRVLQARVIEDWPEESSDKLLEVINSFSVVQLEQGSHCLLLLVEQIKRLKFLPTHPNPKSFLDKLPEFVRKKLFKM